MSDVQVRFGVSGGAVGDMVCIVGRDATHYLTPTYVGTWSNS
jgi:hypothetical protein